MSNILNLHNRDLTDVTTELDRSNNPRPRIIHGLADDGHVYSLNEKDLSPLRRAGTVFQRNEWASPILTDQLPLDNPLNAKQVKSIVSNKIGGGNTYHFARSYRSPEKDAQAIVGLLNNIDIPHCSRPDSILHVQSPMPKRLCRYKPDWHSDNMLDVSQVSMVVTPADGVEDMMYYDNYSLSALLTGTKV
jgi:hypothetical protein